MKDFGYLNYSAYEIFPEASVAYGGEYNEALFSVHRHVNATALNVTNLTATNVGTDTYYDFESYTFLFFYYPLFKNTKIYSFWQSWLIVANPA